jgi:CheY-like chemotaxis protein
MLDLIHRSVGPEISVETFADNAIWTTLVDALGKQLEELGYQVLEASDGPSALRILQANRTIDLLITDVGLSGGMNGRQLADAARVQRPELKVLFVTGYAEHAVLNHSQLEPGMHIMTKPYQMETFAGRVKDLVAS